MVSSVSRFRGSASVTGGSRKSRARLQAPFGAEGPGGRRSTSRSSAVALSELRAKVTSLGTLLGSLDGMIYRGRIDAEWTMEFVSDGCHALTGYAPSDLLLNSRISYESITHPDDREHVRSRIMACLMRRESYDVEYRILRSDGGERWVWERGNGVFDAAGQPLAMEGIIQDVTARRKAEDALRRAEERYRALFEHAIEGIFRTSVDGRYIDANPALAHIYGFESPMALISSLSNISSQLYVDPDRRSAFIQRIRRDGYVTNFESQVYQADGQVIWISENSRAVFDDAGECLYFEGTVEDITERKAYEERIRHQATHDALTGLPNRSLFFDRLELAIARAKRFEHLIAVAYVDLDQFKMINDSLGHDAGDELLKTVAERLHHCLREGDTVARHGGDEFVLILSEQHGKDDIHKLLERVLSSVAQPYERKGRSYSIGASCGVAIFPDDGVDAETLLSNADAAMYRAKQLGRNNVTFYSRELNAHAEDRLELLSRLHAAIEHNEFVLFYQPKICVADGSMSGAEALIRWAPPGATLVTPDCFIPIAEDSGLIGRIGEWVLREACRQGREWLDRSGQSIPISINVSPRQFGQGNLAESVRKALETTGLPPQLLELEITENVVLLDASFIACQLDEIKRLGVRLSIDDFGTGYSSLTYLRRFPIDTVKLDKSFVREVCEDLGEAEVLKAVVALVHAMDLEVLAEGVETREQLELLRNCHCDKAQGYYFSRPVAAQQFIALYRAVHNSHEPTAPLLSRAAV